MALFNIIKAIVVRFILFCHTLLTIWRVASTYGEIYYLLTLALIPYLIEGFYTVIRRKGIEWKWLCPCFVFYLFATLPNIWLLEIQRTKDFGNINTTAVDEINIIGLKIPIALASDRWILVLEESLLYCMIIGRWLLPRGKVSRGQLSDLLFTFIGIASDIMELFELFEEEEVRGSMVLTICLLGLWSWSLFQFTMVLTVASKPIRINLIEQDNKLVCIEPNRKGGATMEVFATLVSLIMQDGPFLGLRLYTIIKFNIINYGLVFFTIKNVLIILLLLYRLLIKLCEECCPGEENKSSIKKKNALEEKRKNGDLALTTEEIIAALLSDAGDIRRRRHKKNRISDSNVMGNGRDTADLNSDITMETIVSKDIVPKENNVDENNLAHNDSGESKSHPNQNQELNGRIHNHMDKFEIAVEPDSSIIKTLEEASDDDKINSSKL